MKASRLLSILMLLQARGRMTASALAQAMEVSPRTILRDIDQLSAAGVPLWGERGHQGGFQLQEGWSTRLTGMTESEASALMLAGLPGPATELGLGAAAASARLKMLASLPAPWREQADRVGQRLHIDPVDWYRARDTPQYLQEIADAVWRGRRLSVRYQSWRGVSRHALEPLGLVLKAGAWYLLARKPDHEGWRTYRLASVQGVSVSAQGFKRPRGFDLAQAWQDSARRFEAGLKPLEARVRLSPRALNWLGNGRLPAVVLNEAGATSPDRLLWREVRLPIESVEHGARQMLGYGAEVEVLAPPELRAEVRRQALLLAAMHADAAPPVDAGSSTARQRRGKATPG